LYHVTIRSSDKLDYLPEPDIFHDVAGMYRCIRIGTLPDTLVRFGECAQTAAGIVRGIRDPEEQVTPAHQHREGNGAVFLVYDRVRADAIARRA